MELINKTDFPPFPGKVGNATLSCILISQTRVGRDEPCDYACAGCETHSPKTICLMSSGFHPLPMMPLGWSWASPAHTLIKRNGTCKSKGFFSGASLCSPSWVEGTGQAGQATSHLQEAGASERCPLTTPCLAQSPIFKLKHSQTYPIPPNNLINHHTEAVPIQDIYLTVWRSVTAHLQLPSSVDQGLTNYFSIQGQIVNVLKIL